MYEVLIRRTAHDSLREVVSYVSADNPDTAEKLGSELIDQALSLESLPFRGSRLRKRPGYLKLVHGNYLTYYRIKEKEKSVEVPGLFTARRSVRSKGFTWGYRVWSWDAFVRRLSEQQHDHVLHGEELPNSNVACNIASNPLNYLRWKGSPRSVPVTKSHFSLKTLA
jgi:plasmid stabilization system protein ParE